MSLSELETGESYLLFMTPKAGDHSWEKQVELIILLFSISSPFLADLDTV